MNIKKTLVLFITVVVVSMALMLVFFGLFFDQLSLKFDTRTPDSAPLVTGRQEASPFDPSETTRYSEADLNVPSEATAKPMAPFMGVDGQHPEPSVVSGTLEDAPPDSQANPLVTPPSENPEASAKPGEEATKEEKPATPKLYRVFVAGFTTEEEAKQALPRYQAQGQNAVVKRHKGSVVIQLGVMSSLEAAKALAEPTGAAIDPI